MSASIQGMGVALPNLAFTLILKSVQEAPAVPRSQSENLETRSPATLVDSHHQIDVKA